MKTLDLEEWVLRVADQAVRGRLVEDSQVEVKAEWPTDFHKAARRIAAHCNAAGGTNVLWVIGLDEKKRCVTNPDPANLANWWPQVQSCFDQLPPNLVRNLEVPYKGDHVHALLFDSDRAPYVIKSKGDTNGEALLETPWREGSRVRSARRDDLLRILIPRSRDPVVKIIGSRARRQSAGFNREQMRHTIDRTQIALEVELYVTPFLSPQCSVVFPYHSMSLSARVVEFGNEAIARKTSLHSVDPLSIMRTTPATSAGPSTCYIEKTSSELILHGPGRLRLDFNFNSALVARICDQMSVLMRIDLQMPSATGDSELRLNEEFTAALADPL